jgi:hypothetical protein
MRSRLFSPSACAPQQLYTTISGDIMNIPARDETFGNILVHGVRCCPVREIVKVGRENNEGLRNVR